jgi:hypothetical protein
MSTDYGSIVRQLVNKHYSIIEKLKEEIRQKEIDEREKIVDEAICNYLSLYLDSVSPIFPILICGDPDYDVANYWKSGFPRLCSVKMSIDELNRGIVRFLRRDPDSCVLIHTWK